MIAVLLHINDLPRQSTDRALQKRWATASCWGTGCLQSGGRGLQFGRRGLQFLLQPGRLGGIDRPSCLGFLKDQSCSSTVSAAAFQIGNDLALPLYMSVRDDEVGLDLQPLPLKSISVH